MGTAPGVYDTMVLPCRMVDLLAWPASPASSGWGRSGSSPSPCWRRRWCCRELASATSSRGRCRRTRARCTIGGVTWHLRALVDLATDAPSPIAVEGLKIVDPEGTVVLDVPYLEAKVRLRSLIGGSFSIHELRVPKALWRFSQLKHGDAIGFLAALGAQDTAARRRRQARRPGRARSSRSPTPSLVTSPPASTSPASGGSSCAHARHGVADPVDARSDAPDLRVRRPVGRRRGGRRAAHPGRQRAAVRAGGHQPDRHHPGPPRRHPARPRRGRHGYAASSPDKGSFTGIYGRRPTTSRGSICTSRSPGRATR